MSGRTNSDAASRPAFYKYAFLGLLAVNLLVIGGILGAMWRHGGHHHGGGGLPGFVRSLDADRRDAIRGAFANRRETMRPLRQAARAKRAALSEVLKAKPFDKARVETALEEMREARNQVRDAREQLFLNAVTLMTDEEREAFAEWRKRHRGRRFRGPR